MRLTMTKGQKKIISAAAIVCVSIILFWLFVYGPAKRSVNRLKAELLGIESQISAIEGMVGKEKPLEQGVAILQQQLDELDKKFLANEQEALRLISKLAYKHGLDVTSIKPQQKNYVTGSNKKAILIDGRACQRLPIAMIAKASYNKIGAFFETLHYKIPYLVAVERLKLAKTATQDHELSADIALSVYLLTE